MALASGGSFNIEKYSSQSNEDNVSGSLSVDWIFYENNRENVKSFLS